MMSRRFTHSATLGFLIGAMFMTCGLLSSASRAEAPHEEAQAEVTQAITVADAWVRAPILPGRPASMYFTINNEGETTDRLVRVTASGAAWAEIHTHVHDDGVMRMRKLEDIEIPAGETVAFAPGGHHIMLFDPDKTVRPGQTLTATLYFEAAGAVEIEAEIRPLNSR